MFDNYLIRADSLHNEMIDGQIVGFTMAVRIANYRGVFLSLHTGYHISVDGVVYPRKAQSFAVNGVPPRSFDAIKSAVWEHWDFDDEAVLHIRKPGGLLPGVHEVAFQQCVIAAYGYMPTDADWVKEPPVPGTGAGSDKTPQVITYHLTLTDRPEA
ncbi:MAG: DUF6379 domain-containing protein [Sphingopyxis sp.]